MADEIKKEKKEQWHADFKKGDIPTRKTEINLAYIQNYCLQDKEKAKWLKETMKKYYKVKGAHLKVRKDFVDKYYPQFNEKPKTAAHSVKPMTVMERYMAELEAFLDSEE